MTVEKPRTSKNYTKFRELLQTLFRMDQADLDFGIYRIMNQKRDEINRFLDNDLLPQVKAAFEQYQPASKANLEAELEQAIQQARSLGAEPDALPRVQQLRKALAEGADVSALEEQVFSHLANFFARYYDNGDFMSLRRYKEGVYAIPYEGEEVKLHWANADQYYVKTAENFTNYTFKLPDGRRVHFELVTASTEQNNVKEAEGRERRFVLDDVPLEERNGELVIRFQYRPVEGRARQDALNKETLESVFAQSGFDSWMRGLQTPVPTERNKDRTLLEKHLSDYTARNTFDYFIHKDLGGFLRRELDFYIKNEVMHLDDIEEESAPKVEQYLSLIKVIRSIAHKIIAFLEQIENFQKKLWLKKKFVIETQYCITLDRVPEELYEEIAANDAQREEWVKLFAIDEIEGDLTTPGYSEPLTVEFLKANQNLVLDTRHFDANFKDRMLKFIDNLDEQCDGVLFHSENFQALNLMRTRYEGDFKNVYIDPPYNTDASEIMYKNGYRHSTWLSLMYDRIRRSYSLLRNEGILCVAIDDFEMPYLNTILTNIFGAEYRLATVAVRANPHGRAMAKGFSPNHEYALFYARSRLSEVGRLPRDDDRMARYPARDSHGPFAWMNLRKTGAGSARPERPRLFYPIYVVDSNGTIEIPEMVWHEERREWVPTQAMKDKVVVLPIDPEGNERVWNMGLERARREANNNLVARKTEAGWQIFRKYRPNEQGALPGTWWQDARYSATESGTRIVTHMMGTREGFSYPKSLFLVKDSLRASNCGSEDMVLDYFAGSGTTAHAVIDLNREDAGRRKYVLVEMGTYFDTVLLPRILKAIYASEWRNGHPISRSSGTSHMLKYIRLESYEDTLNNLELTRTQEQARLLKDNAELREEYMLSYMLDFETGGSPSLLNVEGFAKPDEYKLKIERHGEIRVVNVDLVETFNWLLGLRVKQMSVVRGVRVVDGVDPKGERVLILWRDVETMDNDALDKWFHRQQYSTRDLEYDVIYVNGDNNLENWRREDQTWKVRLIEDAFHRLMFDTNDL